MNTWPDTSAHVKEVEVVVSVNLAFLGYVGVEEVHLIYTSK